MDWFRGGISFYDKATFQRQNNNKDMIRGLLFVVLLILAVSARDAPIYDYAWSINFDQSVTQGHTVYKVNGKAFYDPQNDRERVDRTNGRYD